MIDNKMELIDRQFATNKKDLDDVLDRVRYEQKGCDVVIKTIKNDDGTYWVNVYV